MIDYIFAQKVMKKYLEAYQPENDKIQLKIVHTYKVIESAEYIAKQEKFSQEDTQLAKLIALLHDIGRFEQLKLSDDFRDTEEMDHAKLGVKILFEDNLIRNFIVDNQYDNIIYKAILNHNRLAIEQGLNEKQLLHSKVIRDADKLDNFRVKEEEKIETLLYLWNQEEIENSLITNKIYEDFMNAKCIKNTDRITPADYWTSYLAFIFDFNFKASYEYIAQKDYIQRNLNRIEFKNEDTKKKMLQMQNFALGYLKNKIAN